MKRTYLTLVILMLAIGFAAVSANLVLSGTLKIGFNSGDFEEGVVFTKATSINGTASIQENNKTINYTTNKLDNIGEESTLDYDITNKSNQYDADVIINCELKDTSSTYDEYIELTNEDLDDKFTLAAGATEKGRVKVKLKKSYVASDNNQIQFTCKIVATAKEKEETAEYKPETIYTETALNGADPVLEGNGISTVSLEETEEKKLIPVTIDEDGTVKYADVTTKWYDYENQKWANAVILSNYNHIPKVGEVIPEEDIESYFVWIPKYKYQLWNVNTDTPTKTGPFQIEIEFGVENTEDEQGKSCKTPLNDNGTQALSGNIGQCDNNEWMTHPAFLTLGVNGFWVGKFETGYKEANSKTAAQQDNSLSNHIVIKPDVYSWRSISLSNMLQVEYNYSRNLDSHMIKNTEWGAVAYLSHSKYGINKEIAINNNSDFKTGYATLTTLKQDDSPGKYGITEDYNKKYYTEDGIKGSTTGNITGVYDMAGGTWEYVAAYRDGVNHDEYDEKYFDVYNSNSSTNSYQYKILGDATGEMGPFETYADGDKISRPHNKWYSDSSYFVSLNNPWFGRGGYYVNGVLGGQFYFYGHTGYSGSHIGSRLVLSPQ